MGIEPPRYLRSLILFALTLQLSLDLSGHGEEAGKKQGPGPDPDQIVLDDPGGTLDLFPTEKVREGIEARTLGTGGFFE